MEKINIAELLKDCPKGMELDSPMFENLEFGRIDKDNGAHPIICRVKTERGYYNTQTFTEYGCYGTEKYSKCVIFPKGKNTWEGFQRPFKDGDIVITKTSNNFIFYSIYKGIENRKVLTYVDYKPDYNRLINANSALCYTCEIIEQRLATEEEKVKFFQAIKENGYKWNAETKTLEKLQEFNDGDIVATEIGSIFIYNKSLNSQDYFGCYAGLSCIKSPKPKIIIMDEFSSKTSKLHFANEEEKAKFFQAIKENGYYWNEKIKTLEKLFKVGDIIQDKYSTDSYKVRITNVNIEDEFYGYESLIVNGIGGISFSRQNDWELALNKFDITTLESFESKVLVRDDKDEKWIPAIWGYYDTNNVGCYPYQTVGGNYFSFCIPYESNEHLLGKTDDCDDFYKTWE